MSNARGLVVLFGAGGAALAGSGLVGACGERGGAGADGARAGGDRPEEVFVQRVISAEGARIVSFTAMYPDGIETYVDLQPHGTVDLVSVQRDGQWQGQQRRFVREGAGVALPADGPAAEPLDESWQRRFGQIASMVDAERVPWSDGHTGLSPAGGGG
jgi:hypothetical protein